MSAIIGLCEPRGKCANRMTLSRMLDRLKHCGPDGSGLWCDRHVGLGHRMLHTTPESLHERLPHYDPETELALTCDARIDNRPELIEACGLSGRPEKEITDSDLILAAYQVWGESCAERLLGDFAFALWDGRKQQLFCARDVFGVKPFFYYHSGERFLLATEIKALFSLPEVPRNLNEARIGDYLLGSWQDTASTFFEGVFRLPPAHTLVLRSNRVTIRRYWQPEMSPEHTRSSDAEYAEEFRSIFSEAVRCRVRSAFPVGSMLSGGMDSSSIACMARNQLQSDGRREDLHTFSAIFRGFKETDETEYIEAVLRGGGFVPHFFAIEQARPWSEVYRALGDLDDVFRGAYVDLPRDIYAGAQAEGVRVVLDGLGGDEVVSHGLPYLGDLLRNGSWQEFGQEVASLAHHFGADRSVLARTHLGPYLATLKNQGNWFTLARALVRIPKEMDDSVPRFIRDYAFSPFARKLRRHIFPTEKTESASWARSIVNDDFADSISLAERSLREKSSVPYHPPTEREAHLDQITNNSLWMTLEEFGHTAAPFHVEPRYPQLDRRLLEFCLSLPSSQKLSEGRSRAVFRRAMDNILPEEIRSRGGKADFRAPFEHSMREYRREFLDETIMNTPARIERYFNVPVLRERYRRFLAGDASDVYNLWRVSNLIWWLRESNLLPLSQQVQHCETRV